MDTVNRVSCQFVRLANMPALLTCLTQAKLWMVLPCWDLTPYFCNLSTLDRIGIAGANLHLGNGHHYYFGAAQPRDSARLDRVVCARLSWSAAADANARQQLRCELSHVHGVALRPPLV